MTRFVPARPRRQRRTLLVLVLLVVIGLYHGVSPGRLFASAGAGTNDKDNDGSSSSLSFSSSLSSMQKPKPKLPLVPMGSYTSQADLPMEYGANARLKLDDLVQLASLPKDLVPTRRNSRRLVIVGDVHGMRASLEELLRKVEFDGFEEGMAQADDSNDDDDEYDDDNNNKDTGTDYVEKDQARRGKDHLILTGDLVNKGPDSAGVVSLAMKLGASAVRGNHEDRVLLARANMRGRRVADAVDGTGTNPDDPSADSLEQEVFSHGDYQDRSTARALSRKQIHWLASRPVILDVGRSLDEEEDDDNDDRSSSDLRDSGIGSGRLVVVHAGLVPGVLLERQSPWAVMNMRSLVYPREQLRRDDAKKHVTHQMRLQADRRGPRGAAPFGVAPPALVEREYERRRRDTDRDIAVPVDGHDGQAWAGVWDDFQAALPRRKDRTTVVFGHDSKRGLHVGKYSFGLDTGCVRGGRLTALVVEGGPNGLTHRLVHVKCKAPE